MVTTFHASEVSSVPVEGICTVAFADSSLNQYLLLQLDEETNDHYLEFGDQSKSAYGAVGSAFVRSGCVTFNISLAASAILGANEVEVEYSLSESELQSMSAVLSRILGGGRVQIL
jgi:hypothetical protein